MASRFKPATREKIKLRMAIDGPSGSGKTATALRCAQALGRKIAVIDTESGSARKYVGEDFGDGIITFFGCELTTFSPTEYVAAIEDAATEGVEVIVIDSLSHAWEGKDGALELKDRIGGNSFTAWKDITPMHRRMVDAILTSPCHVIATMRSKTEYVMEKDAKGKDVPRKIGMAPIQRSGMEYEFDVYLSMDWSHIGTVTKSRCPTVDGIAVVKPGRAFMDPVIRWLEKGTETTSVAMPSPRVDDQEMAAVVLLLGKLGWPVEIVRKDLPRKYGVQELNQLTGDQARDLIKWLEAQLAAVQRRNANGTTPHAGPGPNSPPAINGPVTPRDEEHADDSQLAQITVYYGDLTEKGLMTPEKWKGEMLAPFGVISARQLTAKQANALLCQLINLASKSDPPVEPIQPFANEPTTTNEKGGTDGIASGNGNAAPGSKSGDTTTGASDGAQTLQDALAASDREQHQQRAEREAIDADLRAVEAIQ